jgi:hypothetical protein
LATLCTFWSPVEDVAVKKEKEENVGLYTTMPSDEEGSESDHAHRLSCFSRSTQFFPADVLEEDSDMCIATVPFEQRTEHMFLSHSF